MSETMITAATDETTLAGLDTLAGVCGSSREWLIATAVEKYVEEEIAHQEFVARIRTRLQAKRAA